MTVRISERQYRAALDLVGEVNDARDLGELRAGLLTRLRTVVPNEICSYNEVHEDGRAVALSDPEVPETAHAAWARHAPSNPLYQRFLATRDGRPYRFSDVVDPAEFRRSPLYLELYAPLGLEHQMALVLPSSPALTIAIALNRGGPDFTDAERDLLGLLRPHLIQAYRNAQLRERTAGALQALGDGLDGRGTAAAVVAADGRVEFANRGAQALGVREGEPPPEVPGLLAQRVRRSDGSTVVFLERAERVLTPEALEALGLTPAEARVLAALARGSSTDEAAAELALSPRTVLKHGERIHRKLGVRDRAQAVATAWAATSAAGTR